MSPIGFALVANQIIAISEKAARMYPAIMKQPTRIQLDTININAPKIPIPPSWTPTPNNINAKPIVIINQSNITSEIEEGHSPTSNAGGDIEIVVRKD